MTQDMQDKLEKYVSENKEKFDTLTPNDSIWEGIRSQLDASTGINYKLMVWRAAAILMFILSIGLMFYVNRESIVPSNKEFSTNDEFVNTEKYYTSIIKERQQQIESVVVTHPDIESDFTSDWIELDRSYARLKKDYNTDQSTEVLHALIQNLQARVNLLNKQYEVIRKVTKEDESHLQI